MGGLVGAAGAGFWGLVRVGRMGCVGEGDVLEVVEGYS